MKPHEETWSAKDFWITSDDRYAREEVAHIFGERSIADARAKLAAQAPAMAKLLLRLSAFSRGYPNSLTQIEVDLVLRDAGVVP
jgi:hypothetical protein